MTDDEQTQQMVQQIALEAQEETLSALRSVYDTGSPTTVPCAECGWPTTAADRVYCPRCEAADDARQTPEQLDIWDLRRLLRGGGDR